MTRTLSFAPYEIVEGARDRGLLLLADHARNDLPDAYGDLGLPAAEFERLTAPLRQAARQHEIHAEPLESLV